MQLTIIPSDKFVSEDGLGYSPLDMSSVPAGVHALQFDTSINYGWIEYDLQPDGVLPPNEDIFELPSWAVTCQQEWATADYNAKNPPPPTPAEALFKCKSIAMAYLAQTDWATIPDVADPIKSNPYLTNTADFVSYRNVIRNLAINPVENPVWPTMPTAQWSS